MTDINWNVFKVKFHERENAAFERLAYVLFCSEFNITVGIFRYKNQTGIETEPICRDGEVIGFQAKFYDTKLSAHKQEIIDGIKKAKRKNNDLTKIYLYLNQEIGESSSKHKKEPKFVSDIQSVASALQLTIIWRVPSHFELQLLNPQNVHLASYFFSTGKSIVERLEELAAHGTRVLDSIRTQIPFGKDVIKIDRHQEVSALAEGKALITIVSGEGGSGKTAVVKEWFKQINAPIYLFKATEFKVNTLLDIFNPSTRMSIEDFIDAHRSESEKAVIIDSAEKISDIDDQEPFKEFLDTLITNGWRVIFTTRNAYLEELEFQLIRIYATPFEHIKIKPISKEQLLAIGTEKGISLPDNPKVLSLIQNLFYLGEFIRHYSVIDLQTDLESFRNVIWQQRVQNISVQKGNLHLERENCFLALARQRAAHGHFFLLAGDCSATALKALCDDEIISYDKNNRGYFITHDLYEEWALEHIIDSAYNQMLDFKGFFEEIGITLPVRRAFRSWVSGKLENDQANNVSFVERLFNDDNVATFWRDELLVSILLSPYIVTFYSIYRKTLLDNEKRLFKKIVFLLRIACKEVDQETYNRVVQSYADIIDPSIFFTKPKGPGWPATIAFLNDNVDSFVVNDLVFIAPLLKEWTYKRGITTRNAASFAFHFFDQDKSEDERWRSADSEDDLIAIMLNGAAEIVDQLKPVFQTVLTITGGNSDHKYDKFCETVLTDKDLVLPLVSAMPDEVIGLADHLWFKPKAKEDPYDFGGTGTEKYYGIRDRWHNEYSPVSGLQTPISWMLFLHIQKAVDFLLAFTNKTVTKYYQANIEEVEEVELIHGDGGVTKQYISSSIWNMYRGYCSPTTPDLLQCLHMALEKRLMEMAEQHLERTEEWLFYLLRQTKSASITAVVTSVVLKYPDQLFNVAALLFTVPEFYLFDNRRFRVEDQVKTLYYSFSGIDYRKREFEQERLKTCDESFRKTNLEFIARNFQFFKRSGISDEDFTNRKDRIHQILDQLQIRIESSGVADKTISLLLLARLDGRKMEPTIEHKKDEVFVSFNPALTPELKQISQEAEQRSEEFTRFTELDLWATNKFEPGRGKNYERYDNNPELVLEQTRLILQELEEGDDAFVLMNRATPAYACYALLSDHQDQLSEADIQFCKDTAISYAVRPLSPDYHYQIADGVEVAINTLPFFYNEDRETDQTLNLILLLILFDIYPIGNKRICDYAIDALIRQVSKKSPSNFTTVFLSYLYFKPKWEETNHPKKSGNARNFDYRRTRTEMIDKFCNTFEDNLKLKLSGDVNLQDVDFSLYELADWETGFQFIIADTQDPLMLEYAKMANAEICKLVLVDQPRRKRANNWDYYLPRRFYKKFAYFILCRRKEDLTIFLQPFLNHFDSSSEMGDVFGELIFAEDFLKHYDIFWEIWDVFYEKMKALSNRDTYSKTNETIHNYLLAWRYWGDSMKSWHSLRDRERLFYKKVATEMGNNPATLYSFSKVLNEIGSDYLNEGIEWLSILLTNNPQLATKKLETNTIYYLQLIARKFVYNNRTILKSNRLNKKLIMTLLDFLIEKGSVSAYLLREDIL